MKNSGGVPPHFCERPAWVPPCPLRTRTHGWGCPPPCLRTRRLRIVASISPLIASITTVIRRINFYYQRTIFFQHCFPQWTTFFMLVTTTFGGRLGVRVPPMSCEQSPPLGAGVPPAICEPAMARGPPPLPPFKLNAPSHDPARLRNIPAPREARGSAATHARELRGRSAGSPREAARSSRGGSAGQFSCFIRFLASAL